ncbi:unnamed protein product [Diabrotica balteata]|uniref:Uncharacterized protein n=1 Tax=Diabrotica balteata TaxID=107213 RepID=A0A9N9TBL9_DIABA|nr:unnamed protein product [Diabrotica balteata]
MEINIATGFNNSVKKLKTINSWAPRALFLLVSLQRCNRTREKAEEIFHILYGQDIFKVVIVLLNPQGNFSFNVYAMPPYLSETGKSPLSDICKNGIFSYGRKFEYNDLPVSRGKIKYAIRAKYFPWSPFTIMSKNSNRLNQDRPGFEVNLLNSFSKYINVSIAYEPIEFHQTRGDCFDNGSCINEFKDLYEKRYEVLIGGYTPYYEQMLYFRDVATANIEHEVDVVSIPPDADPQTDEEDFDENNLEGVENIFPTDVVGEIELQHINSSDKKKQKLKFQDEFIEVDDSVATIGTKCQQYVKQNNSMRTQEEGTDKENNKNENNNQISS